MVKFSIFFWQIKSSNERIQNIFLNAADTGAVDNSETHVACVTPCLGPGVLHNPVLPIFVLAPTNNKGGVVQVRSTCGVIIDTTVVVLESWFVGLNCHRKRLLLEGLLHLVRVLLFYVLLTCAHNLGVWFGVVFAFTEQALRSVHVVILKNHIV